MIDSDICSPEVSKLVQLFSAQPALKFPDLDAGVLHEAIARLKERHLEVAKAEAVLQASRGAFDDEYEAVVKLAQRAQAYLRVFAETDEALLERVEAIALPRVKKSVARGELTDEGAPAPTPKRRGRPPKARSEGPLFAAEAPAESAPAAFT